MITKQSFHHLSPNPTAQPHLAELATTQVGITHQMAWLRPVAVIKG